VIRQEYGAQFQFQIYRVPFFLEPGYLKQPENFWESHDTRMIRKFGSKQAFDRVKVQHQLVPRAQEAGLTEAMGFTEENLSKRRQSSTLNAHRLVQYVTKVFDHLSLSLSLSLLSLSLILDLSCRNTPPRWQKNFTLF
jgi:hypothetical protein